MKIYFRALALAILFISCSQNSNEDGCFQDISKSEDPNGIEFCTSDTILKTNYPLVRLMDTLYQYVKSDSFPSESLRSEIQWMENYRHKLVSYYDLTHTENDYIFPLDKADSVISEARELWNIDKDYSTIGMIIHNDTERTRLIFEQFNEYEKLLTVCRTEHQKNLLYNELVEWFELEQLFSQLYANCVDLYYWSGSIAGPKRTNGYISIWQSHIDMYKNEYLFLATHESVRTWTDTGTFLKPAKELLLSCSKQALAEYYCRNSDVGYEELYRDTQELIRDLPRRIDSWIKARKSWEDEMSSDSLHQTYSRNTSTVLIKLANIISSVQ